MHSQNFENFHSKGAAQQKSLKLMQTIFPRELSFEVFFFFIFSYMHPKP